MILKIEAKIIKLDGEVLSSDDRIMQLSSSRDMDVFESELMHQLYLIKRSSMKMVKQLIN